MMRLDLLSLLEHPPVHIETEGLQGGGVALDVSSCEAEASVVAMGEWREGFSSYYCRAGGEEVLFPDVPGAPVGRVE